MNAKSNNYVSRAALKLASANEKFKLDFRGKVILDVGSSTGGFSDFALQNGAKKVIAVDSGSNQLHPKLRQNSRIEVHEKTDVRDFKTNQEVDLILIDVSFISIRNVLPSVIKFCGPETRVAAMVKPQFEAGPEMKNRGVVKNENIRRQILKEFENWAKKRFVITSKADSEVHGAQGNQERFYLLTVA